MVTVNVSLGADGVHKVFSHSFPLPVQTGSIQLDVFVRLWQHCSDFQTENKICSFLTD